MHHTGHGRSLATGVGIFEELDYPVTVNAAGEVFEGRSFPGNGHLGVAVAIGAAEFGGAGCPGAIVKDGLAPGRSLVRSIIEKTPGGLERDERLDDCVSDEVVGVGGIGVVVGVEDTTDSAAGRIERIGSGGQVEVARSRVIESKFGTIQESAVMPGPIFGVIPSVLPEDFTHAGRIVFEDVFLKFPDSRGGERVGLVAGFLGLQDEAIFIAELDPEKIEIGDIVYSFKIFPNEDRRRRVEEFWSVAFR